MKNRGITRIYNREKEEEGKRKNPKNLVCFFRKVKDLGRRGQDIFVCLLRIMGSASGQFPGTPEYRQKAIFNILILWKK
ncbi:MAG: hypothetical protein ACLTDM_00405 [Clostridium butyricum]